MPRTRPIIKTLLILAPLGMIIGMAALAQNWLDERLMAPSYLSGWTLALILGMSAAVWWPHIPNAANLRKKLGLQIVVGALMLFLFLVHIELRLPDGLIERALSIGFELLMTCLLIGGLLVFAGNTSPEHLKRWLKIQVSVHWSLLGLAIFHGIFVHVHCSLAHFLFYSNQP